MRLFRCVIWVVLFTSILNAGSSHAGKAPREVSVMDFDQFESWLHKETDSIYVINFWATWCAPCIREIPDFEQLHTTYASDKVKVLLVSLDNPNRLENSVIPFLDRLSVNSEVVLLDDPFANRWIPRVSDQWSGAIPATVIYSKTQKHFYEREFKFEELEKIVLPLINKP